MGVFGERGDHPGRVAADDFGDVITKCRQSCAHPCIEKVDLYLEGRTTRSDQEPSTDLAWKGKSFFDSLRHFSLVRSSYSALPVYDGTFRRTDRTSHRDRPPRPARTWSPF
jgi:hypothetical protein